MKWADFGMGSGQNIRANLVPLRQLAGVVGQDDHPFLLGRHCAGCGCEGAGGEESSYGCDGAEEGHVLWSNVLSWES